ncbi:MAG: ArsB/NhaD family transporter [Thermoplasmata archaeon]
MYDKAIIAVAILVFTYALIMSEKVERSIAALLGAMLVFVFGIVKSEDLMKLDGFMHWEALGLIFGMFILVETLRHTGFFRWIGLHTLHAAKFRPLYIFIFFSGMSAFLSAFMDSITVLFFMASLTIEVAHILKMSPIPFIIAEITAANIGGSATMVGDPPNVILGTAFGYSFMDFVVNVAIISIAVFFVNLAFFYFWYKKHLKSGGADHEKIAEEHKELDPWSAVTDKKLMYITMAVFTFTVSLLVLHSALKQFSPILGSVAFAAILGATLVLVLGGKKMPGIVTKIDWKVLIFFACLFIVVGGLENTGVTKAMGDAIGGASKGNIVIAITLILWSMAFLSAFVDNVPVAAVMIPVIREIHTATGFPESTLVWTTAIGTDIGGNGTPIGASANVVGMSVCEHDKCHITWKEYCKVAMPAMVVTITVCNILLILMYGKLF